MLKRVVTALCCGLSFMVSAAQVTDLYQGKAPTSGDMAAAQSQALGEVLIKVTGKRDILTQPAVVKALTAPGEFVQHYGYQDVGPVKFLKADFDVAKVNALVAESKFALLGPARPQVAIWLVINEGERRILPDQSSDGWAAALRTQAQAMGLPISIPLMDLDDNMAVNATDVWGRFADPILKASQRYGAEMVVLGKLTPEGESWSIDWGLYGVKPGAQAGELTELTKGSGSGSQAEVAKGRRILISDMPMERVSRAKEEGETTGLIRLIVDGDTGVFLGATVFGFAGDEIIATLSNYMATGSSYQIMQQALPVHPTVAEYLPTILAGLTPLETADG